MQFLDNLRLFYCLRGQVLGPIKNRAWFLTFFKILFKLQILVLENICSTIFFVSMKGALL